MISHAIGRSFGWLRDALAGGLVRLRVSPNSVTVAGCLVTLAGGALIALGRLGAGGLVLVAAGACDMLDGAVARIAGRKTPFGGFLDSTLDRISDLGIFGGLALHFAGRGNLTYTLLSLAALGAAEVISYTRARAECLIESCKVGFWERGERTVLLIIALVAGRPLVVLWVLATLPWLTVLHRIVFSWRALLEPAAPADAPPAVSAGRFRRPGRLAVIGRVAARLFFFSPRRGSIPYDIAVVTVIAAVLFAPLRETDPLGRLRDGAGAPTTHAAP